VAVWLAPVRIHIDNPPRPGILATRLRHHALLPLLNPHPIVIHPDLHRGAPHALIHLEATMVEPNLAMLPDGPRELAEA
jgi:hypothetical protein